MPSLYTVVKNFLNRYPMVWKGLISGTLFSAADVFAQKVIEKRQQIDKTRNLNFLIIGLCWYAPAIELWYSNILPKITSRYLQNFTSRKRLVYRTLIDVTIFGPTAFIGFYIMKSYLQKGTQVSKQQIWAQLIEKIPPTLAADWSMWIPVNLINFAYIPIQYQGLCVGICTFFFNIILSMIAFNEDIFSFKNSEQTKESLNDQIRT